MCVCTWGLATLLQLVAGFSELPACLPASGLQVPRHEFRVEEGEGREKVEISVQLPGVCGC